MNLNPKDYGLPPRTVLKRVDPDTIAILMHRKSRIIMADARKILEKCTKIQRAEPATTVILRTTAPVCSKTLNFLESSGISVVED